eukprot:2182487-Rhodomonas_salina.1
MTVHVQPAERGRGSEREKEKLATKQILNMQKLVVVFLHTRHDLFDKLLDAWLHHYQGQLSI